MTYQLLRGNALALPLANASVDLVVTSPPYFNLRAYTDDGEAMADQIGAEATPTEFVDALLAATAEMVRVLKPSGSIWVNLNDKYAGSSGTGNNNGLTGTAYDPAAPPARSAPKTYKRITSVPRKSLIGVPWRYALRCIDELGLTLRAEVIWSKAGMPEPVKDRVRRTHETWFHFTKGPHYYADLDPIREPYVTAEKGKTWAQRRELGFTGATRGINVSDQAKADGGFARHPKGRLPASVWNINTSSVRAPEHLGKHHAAFPLEWPRRIILGWSPPDGVVLDPFSGTGSTVAMADALGRHGVGVDLSASYIRLAQWRIEESGHAEKALQKARRAA